MRNASYPCAGTERPMKGPDVTRRAADGRLNVREGGEGQGGRDQTSSHE
ncbi:MAG: hypothetical protein ACREJ6_03285 [Candidatus Methylomirabilis sp.]